MKRRSLILTVLALLAGAPAARAAGAPRWLLREWELTHDPDGDPKDFIEFFDNGQVIHTSHQGKRTTGAWMVRGEEVKVTFILPNGRTLPLSYAVDSGRGTLRLRSPRTGSVAVYEPRGR